jgi:hypothetical protein
MATKHDVTETIKGYSEKIDITKLDPGHLIKGSQNVMIKDARTVGIRKGYTLVGQKNKTDIKPITASFDFDNFKGDERNLRTWGDRIEVLLDGNWELLKDGFNDGTNDLSDFYFSKQDFWDHDRKLAYAVFVNNTENIYKWNGAITKLASVTSNTITKEGDETWAETGFERLGRTEMEFKIKSNEQTNGINLSITTIELATGTEATYSITVAQQADSVLTAKDMANKWEAVLPSTTAIGTSEGNKVYVTCKKEFLIKSYTTSDTEYDYILPDPVVIETPTVTINGIVYSYTGGYGTNVLTGVTPDPTVDAPVAGSYIYQSIQTIPNTDILDLPDNNKNTAVEILDNQLYIASENNRFVYVSEISRTDSFYFGRPERLVGEGARLTLGGNFNGMSPREGSMYIQFGFGSWVQTKLIDSANLSSQSLVIRLLDVNAGDGVINKRGIAPMKNQTMFVSKDKAFNFIGRIENIETPQTKNISDEVKELFLRLDFDDMDLIYHKHYIYITAPKSSTVLIYNLERRLWEAPQIMSISCFSIIQGELHGHSYLTPQTFKLFDGLSDNGVPIEAIGKMSYDNSGSRTMLKAFNEFFVEGHIEEKTVIDCKILFDIDGSTGERPFTLAGNNPNILYKRDVADASLGKQSLGKRSLGSTAQEVEELNKFIAFKGLQNEDHYEYSFQFGSNQDNAQWDFISFGPATKPSSKQSVINKI